jgi:hypothetical protein
MLNIIDIFHECEKFCLLPSVWRFNTAVRDITIYVGITLAVGDITMCVEV